MIVEGVVNGQTVPQVLEHHRLGHFVQLENYTHEVNAFPMAAVTIQISGFTADLEFAVQDNLSYAVLLGLDLPYLCDVVFFEIDQATVLLVQTRQQALRYARKRYRILKGKKKNRQQEKNRQLMTKVQQKELVVNK